MANSEYEYMNEKTIDDDLKCHFCKKPLIDPVSTPCLHTFCRECIESKINSDTAVCPEYECNKSFVVKDLTPEGPKLRKMLARLLVKCNRCEQTNIQRSAFDDHVNNQCPKATVQCSAADIKCPWTGSADQLKPHKVSCIYEQLRPVLVGLIIDTGNIKNRCNDLQSQNDNLRTENQHLNQRCNTYETQIDKLNARIQEMAARIRKASSRQLHLLPTTKWTQNGVTVAGGRSGGNELNQLYNPWGVYVDDDQTVYVADQYNQRIVEWKCEATSGHLVAGVNGQKNRSFQLSYPTDVIIDQQTDSLIICDRGNGRVVRWPREGGTSGQTIISNVRSWGLTMDDDGFLYVSDFEKHEVRRWRIGESEGTLVAGGNGPGQRLDQLSNPYFIFVDRDHSVYVSDTDNHRVMKWIKDAKEGVVVAGGHGQGNALTQLSNPRGVIVDQLGTVYVADCWNSRIMCWCKGATQGNVVVGGNGGGNQANQLNGPCGLSLDRDGNFYVVDNQNHRVQKFSIIVV